MANYDLEFMNFDGETFKVEIMDTTVTEDVFTPLRTDGTGFTLTWQGATNETYKAVLESSFSIDIQIDADSLQLLDDLAASVMGRFEIVISKLIAPATYKIMWTGFVLQDTMVRPDAYTDMDCITIQASDGFGELKDQEWLEFDIADPLAQRTVIQWLSAIMLKMPLTYRISTLPVFKIASNWYENSMTPADAYDPLNNTRISESVFVNVDDYGVVKANTYYEILTTILEAFNLQITQWNGEYLVIQQNTYTQSIGRAWNYDKDGLYLSTEILNLQQTMPTRLSGGMFTYLTPIRKITTEYEYKNSIFPNNLFPSTIAEGIEYDLGLFETRTFIHISGSFFSKAIIPIAVNFVFALEYSVIIKNGSYYLEQPARGVSPFFYRWTLTPSVIKIYTPEFIIDSIEEEYESTVGASLSIYLPSLIADDESITFEYSLTNIIGYVSTVTSLGGELVGQFTQTDTNPLMEGTRKYEASVNEDIKYDLELNKSIIGDGVYKYSSGGLRIYNGSAWVKSDGWTIFSEIGSTPLLLHQLRCREMLALRRVTTVFYQGSFAASPDPFKGFTWEGKNWVWTSISWNANENIYQGTALQLNYETDPS